MLHDLKFMQLPANPSQWKKADENIKNYEKINLLGATEDDEITISTCSTADRLTEYTLVCSDQNPTARLMVKREFVAMCHDLLSKGETEAHIASSMLSDSVGLPCVATNLIF